MSGRGDFVSPRRRQGAYTAMGTNFKDVLIRRNELLHRQSIWKEVVDHLAKFLDTDAAPATIGIRTEGEGMVVPQDMIDLAISEISNGYMAEIAEELQKINETEVAENVKQAKQGSTKKGGGKQVGRQQAGKKGRRATASRPAKD